MSKRKYQKPLKVDLDFDEALERFALTDPREVQQEIAKDIGPQPLRLVEDEDTGHRLVIYKTPKGINVDLLFEGETFWATQKQISQIFGVTRENVTMHLGNIYREGELLEETTCKESLRVGRTGQEYRPKIYNLDAIISVGYRVGSVEGTMFRIYSNGITSQYLRKGFVIDKERLKNHGAPSALDEFREIAREIRTSIRNSYREVLKLCTLCSDYDGTSQAARNFFMGMENKLLWASTSSPAGPMTGPQIILTRADATKTDMGLTYYAGKRGPTKEDVKIANNYLAEGEARTKNRMTEMWLTYVEEQLDQGRLPTMEVVREKLDGFIRFNQWPLLRDKGQFKREDANKHALRQLDLFRARVAVEMEAGEPKKLEKKG